MSDPCQNRRSNEHYIRLIEAALAADVPFIPVAESATAIQVERAVVFARCLRRPAVESDADELRRLVSLAETAGLETFRIVDALGHARPEYLPLLAYAWGQTAPMLRPMLGASEQLRWERAMLRWAAWMQSTGKTSAAAQAGAGAKAGSDVVKRAWSALASHALTVAVGGASWAGFEDANIESLIVGQTPEGSFLAPAPEDSLESFWYDELVLLHAMATYAALTKSPRAFSAVKKAADYHVREIQPDHATQEPWALLAFIWHEPARPLADQLLHGVATQHPAGATGIASVLLADAIYCLRLL